MKFYYKTLAFASLLALAACSDFDEMNTNPYEPPYSPGTSNTDVSPEGIDIDYELPEADIKALKEAETSIVNPEKPDVPLNKNDAFQKVQKRRVQEKR